eukprot:CAMPEP_0178464952 /NCGR_PEP_ID=MMETSP0689_2-20121128/51104_1 /TAXON_ID=160604 /ORGANISM="Amphidinium massartii, Strain CS-259" /LENGTH=62 /DNA_ID=CAMNT_0020091863 /DNA_START=505 /DNA_END=690 /DNA_ORIENTATION=-
MAAVEQALVDDIVPQLDCHPVANQAADAEDQPFTIYIWIPPTCGCPRLLGTSASSALHLAET